jgi:arylsulfatase A-like enzyme
MNFIVIIYDTLRYDHLGCNGLRPVRTPNWDAFAGRAWNFGRCYAGSYPSLPHRCDCATGRFVYPFYGWQNLPDDEVHLIAKLTDAGYRTHLISDGGLPIGGGLGRGFASHELVGPQPPEERVAATPLPCARHKTRIPDQLRREWALQNWLVEQGDESLWPQAQVMEAAVDWTAKQAGSPEPFFLWIESWKIHETWVSPPRCVEEYDPGYEGEIVALPAYSPNVDYLTPEELNHVRAMYAASVTFSDEWFGRLIASLEESGLMDDTMIVVSSDHGWSLGDHGRTGKHGVAVPAQDAWPLYEECTHVPLLVHTPAQEAAARSTALAQHADLLPTILDLAGLEGGPTVTGKSWAPILRGDGGHTRDLAVTCGFLHDYDKGGTNTRITLTSADHALILPTRTQQAEFYNLALDPGQTQNVIWRHFDVAKEMLVEFMQLLQRLGADAEKVDSWRDCLRIAPPDRLR